MRTRIGWLAAVCLLATATAARGQVVQLPTFEFFTVNTTVSVPDSGGMYLGGVSNSSTGSMTNGVPGLSKIPGAGRLFANRALGSDLNSATATVSARIHDLSEMDAELLAVAAGRSRDADIVHAAVDRRADFLSANVARATGSSPAVRLASAPVASVAAIRSQNRAAQEQAESEARDLIDQGQQAELDGKRNVAKIFYQMASRRSTGAMKTQAVSHLAELSSPSGHDAKLAQRPTK